jgi:5-methylcytosine-specific restriction endonuclease McrA
MIRPGESARRRRDRSGVPGRLGIVRLYGKDLDALRRDCFDRDESICQQCWTPTSYLPRFDGDPVAYDMAHIQSRGAGGSDTLENVRCLCHSCHMKEHAGIK